MLNGALIKEVKELKSLNILSFDLADSVHKTVIRRIGISKHASTEVRTVLEFKIKKTFRNKCCFSNPRCSNTSNASL